MTAEQARDILAERDALRAHTSSRGITVSDCSTCCALETADWGEVEMRGVNVAAAERVTRRGKQGPR